MKYIRTKDGRIIDLERKVNGYDFVHLEENQLEDGNWGGWYWYSEEYDYELECRDIEIIKQADTIKELCDLYVCVEPNGNHTILPSNSIISIIGTIIYGAIWTDKGLIYVAKMNDRGELCLL